jgi:hypothetical protein
VVAKKKSGRKPPKEYVDKRGKKLGDGRGGLKKPSAKDIKAARKRLGL